METLEGFRRTEGVGRLAHPGELAVPDPVGGRVGMPTLVGGRPGETTEQNSSSNGNKIQQKAKEKQQKQKAKNNSFEQFH